jgi:hypothetical protein
LSSSTRSKSNAGIGSRALQVLNSKPDRSEWIFYFVRHLPRHLSPGEDSLRASDFDAAELEIASQSLRCNTAQPERCDRADDGGKQTQGSSNPGDVCRA